MNYLLKLSWGGVISLLILLGLPGCKRYDKDIQRIDERIDRIENTQINSLNQQVEAINKSLPKLQKTDAELKSYIEKLQGTASDLQKSIKESDGKIDKVKADLDKAISDAKADNKDLKEELISALNMAKSDIVAQLNAAKIEMQGQLDKLKETITELQNKDKELEKKITDIKAYADDGLQKSKDWATATFATLEQYNAITSDISAIKQSIESLNSSVEILEKKLKENVSKEIETAISQVRDQISADIAEEVTNSYTNAISTAKTELTNAYKAEIAASISALETSMKEWVNSALTGYYTISETDAKLTSLKSDLENQLKSQKEYLESLVSALSNSLTEKISGNTTLIQTLRNDLTSAQEDITSNAQSIIDNAESISSNSQKINNNTKSITENSTAIENLEKAVVELKRDLDGKISDLESKLTQVGADVTAINEEITSIRKTYSERIDNLQKVIEGKIAENKESINANKSAISENTKSISANKAAIDALKITAGGSADSFAAQILSNAEKISKNSEDISSNASLIADNAKAISSNAGAIAENTAKISELENSISNMRTEMTESYKAVISSAIADCEGRLKGDIAKEVAALNTRIDSEMEDMRNAMAALTERVKTLESAVADIKTKVSEMGEEIETLQGRVATIAQQISAIDETINKLKTADSELKSCIEALQGTAVELRKSIAANDSKINEIERALEQAIADAKASDSAMKKELVASIEAAKSETLSQLKSMKTEMDSKLEGVNTTIAALKAKDIEIEKKIEELQSYIDGQIQNTKNWASATFATLDQYETVTTEIASLKQTIASLTESLSAMETKLKGKWADDIEAAIAPIKEEISKTAEEIRKGYISAIAETKSEIESAYRAEIASSIASLEASLKTWISSSLLAYSTIAETEAKLDAQKKEIESQLSAQKTYLEEMISNLESSSSEKIQANANLIKSLSNKLDAVKKTQEANAAEIASMKNELAKSKEDITSAYTAAITSAINTLDGKLTEKVNAEISKINERIDNEVAALEQKLSALDDRIGALEGNIESVKSELKAMQDEISALKDQISKIVNKVISISHVPTYEDGYEVVPYTMDGSTIVPGDFTLKFEVAPASAAEEIASVWQSALSAKAVYTLKTKAAGDFVSLTIKSATGKDGILSVKLSATGIADDFFYNNIGLNARINISCTYNEIISDYARLISRSNLEYVDDRGAAYGEAVNIDGLLWAPVNVGASEKNMEGRYYSYEEAKHVCPRGWRLPTFNETNSVKSHYSDFMQFGTVYGRWFSGSREYSTIIPSIFLPAAGYYAVNTSMIEKLNEQGEYWALHKTEPNGMANLLYFNSSQTDVSNTISPSSFKMTTRCVKNVLDDSDSFDNTSVVENWEKTGVVINGLMWAPMNVGTNISNGYGTQYNFEEANTICPSGWRLPSEAELQSLIATSSRFMTVNGRNGYMLSDSSLKLFLPAAGFGGGGDRGIIGCYWSSDTSTNGDKHAKYLDFDNSTIRIKTANRACLYSVRCVKNL